MDCPNCANPNPAGAKFCFECGTKLVAKCPECSTELPPAAKFCFNCGHNMAGAAPKPAPAPEPEAADKDLSRFIPEALLNKLSAAKDAGGMIGERRVVTMLFCDVKGSTAAAENLDPEEWADIMNGAFERLIAPVYRYEGTLARLMGDAILAFFGAPIAHEDDPERAILAALDIVQEIRPYIAKVRAEWGIDIDVRVGVNTGLVVVGNVGSDLRLEYTAMGDAVNLAARMEQTATPGTIQIADDTYRRVEKLFEFEELGAVQVKGKSEPIPAYRVLGPKQRPASERGVAGLDSPMIGRDDELNKLRRAFDELKEGRGRIVSLIGEAGLGKSRLTAEWRKVCTCEDVGWFEGRSLSYERGEPYAPFKGIFRKIFGLTAETGSQAAYQKIITGLRAHFDDDVEGRAAMIASLLQLDLTGEAVHRVRYLQPNELKGKVTGAVLEVVEVMAGKKPMVMVFEDLHWADSASLALVHELQAVTERAMLLLAALFRPRQHEDSWQFHVRAEAEHPHLYMPIKVLPLDADHAQELVANLLKIDGIPKPVRHLILDRAEGNPFFVEEVIRTLIDDGLVARDGDIWRATREITTIKVPDTLNGVLTTRLDKLSDAHRRVAQVASVIGREFGFATLAAVAPDPVVLNPALSELQRRGIVREIARRPVRRFRFKHGLTRDAAYNTLLHKHRRKLHTAVAEYWEKMEVDRLPEIASHFLAGRQVTRALPYLVRAGEGAVRAHAMREARDWFGKALEHLDPATHGDLSRRALEGMHNAAKLTFDVPGAIDTADRLIALGRDHVNPGSEISGLNKMAFVKGMFMGEFAEGAELLQRAEELAHAHEDQMGLIECEMYQCYFNTGAGDFDKVEEYMRHVAQSGEELQVEDAQLFGMAHLSSALMSMTRYDEALRQAKETFEVAERMGNRMWASEVMAWVIPMCHLRNGAVDEARKLAKRGTEMALEVGAAGDAAMGFCAQVQIELLTGNYETAIDASRGFVREAEGTGMAYLMALSHCQAGTAFIETGGSELGKLAMPEHQQAMKLMEMPLGGVHATWMCSEVGFCSLAHDEVDVAAGLFETALTTPNASMHLQRPKALLGKTCVALRREDLPAAWEAFRQADEYVRTREMRHFQPQVLEMGIRVALRRGDLEAARVYIQEAQQVARDLGARPVLYQALAHQASLMRDEGDLAGARSAAGEATAVIDDIAAGLHDPAIRTGFLTFARSKLPAL